MAGKTLREMGVIEDPKPNCISAKEVVLPFIKFPGVDILLGPEMRSTGEVMGIDRDFELAYAKALMGAGVFLPNSGNVFISVRETDKEAIVDLVRKLVALGFGVYTTSGTHRTLLEHGIETRILRKISEGVRPNVLDMIKNRELQMIINTPTRKGATTDEGKIRAAVVRQGIPMATTRTCAAAVVRAIEALRASQWRVSALQDFYPNGSSPAPKRSAERFVTL